MGYKKTITDIGLKWLANSIAGSKVVFDNIVFSDTRIDKDLNNISIDDFINPMAVGVNKLIENDKGFTAMSVTSNKNGEHHKAIAVGVVGHTDNEPDQKLIAVAISDDDVPIFSMEPNQVGNYNISFSVQYSNSANVELNANNIPIANMDDVQSAVDIFIGKYDFESKMTNYATKESVSALSSSADTINNSLSSLVGNFNQASSSITSLENKLSDNDTRASVVTLQNTVNNFAVKVDTLQSSFNDLHDSMIESNSNKYDGSSFWIVDSSMLPLKTQNTLSRYYSSGVIVVPGLDINKSQQITIKFDNSSKNPHMFVGLGMYQNDHGGPTVSNINISTEQLRNGGSYNWLSGMPNANITAPTSRTLCFTGSDGSQSTRLQNDSTVFYYAIISSITIS